MEYTHRNLLAILFLSSMLSVYSTISAFSYKETDIDASDIEAHNIALDIESLILTAKISLEEHPESVIEEITVDALIDKGYLKQSAKDYELSFKKDKATFLNVAIDNDVCEATKRKEFPLKEISYCGDGKITFTTKAG